MARRGPRTRALESDKDRQRLVRALKKGVSIRAACAMAGVVHQTLLNEMDRDPAFKREVDDAQEHARATLEQRFFDASGGKEGDWKAAMQMLSRRYPDDWAQRRPDAIEIRKLVAHFTAFASGVVEFVEAEKQEPFKAWFQNWVDKVLADDRSE